VHGRKTAARRVPANPPRAASAEDIGLTVFGDRRRVPGLRREELALLAGVSPSYYSRLEQGQSSNASPEVLDAIAQALQLDEAERRHLTDATVRPDPTSGRLVVRRAAAWR
jgi:transcriptional regulator with XRE-family HTH domain